MKKENFNFRYGELFELDEAAIRGLTEKELRYQIASNIDRQIGFVYRHILMFCTQLGIGEEELHSKIAYVKECIEKYSIDDDDLDLTLSSLINYANAMGGIVKIYVELGDGTKKELL